jgi:hypothetical protein
MSEPYINKLYCTEIQMTSNKTMKLFLLLIIVLLFSNASYSQSKRFNGSVIIEGSSLFAETNAELVRFVKINNQYIPESSFKIQKQTYYGFGVYYSGKWNIGKSFYLEIRPGIFSSNKMFSGAQFGFFIQKRFEVDYFMSAGALTELHLSDGGKSYDPTTLNGTYGLSFGRNILDNIALMLTIHKSANRNYGKYWDSVSGNKNYSYLDWTIKLGLEVDI